MSRKPDEIRFQNPAQQTPVQLLPLTDIPLLLGLEDGSKPVIVAADAARRMGKTTRFSVLFPTNLVAEAQKVGWATYDSTSGERIYAFHPALLATYVEMLKTGVEVHPNLMGAAVSGAGLLDIDDEPARERARRSTSTLIRAAGFSRDVVAAYEGRCALCDLALGLVVGAHIYPASAPGSPDVVSNGVALCHNHHAAFDHHRLYVMPETLRVAFDPAILTLTHDDHAVAAFVGGTRAEVRRPTFPASFISDEMLIKRYKYFAGHYDWL
jgi:hypothetical protein